MAPKQVTLGKFFAAPDLQKSEPQQAKLAFKDGKPNSKATSSPPSDRPSAGVKEGKIKQEESSVGKHEQADADPLSPQDQHQELRSEEHATDEFPTKDEIGTHGRHRKQGLKKTASRQSLSSLGNAKQSSRASKLSSPQASQKRPQEATTNGEEAEDEEPVQKRSRRGRPPKSTTLTRKSDIQATNLSPQVDNEYDTADVDHNASVNESTPVTLPHILSSKSRLKTSEIPQGSSVHTNEDSRGEEEEDSSAEVEASESEEDEKPELIAKTREKVQKTLKSSGEPPFPDWKAGDPVPYAALCTTFSLIELTSKRLIILSHCSLFLRQVLRLTPQDLLPTIQLMINKIAADYAGIELGIGESLIMKAIGETTGRSLQVIKADQNDIGDLGLVAAKSRSTQPTMFKPKPLTVKAVLDGLMRIATVSGEGSQGRKIAGIKKLLAAADTSLAGKGNKGIDITKDKGGPSETKYIIRFLEGKLRLGLAEKTVLVALAHAMVIHEGELKGKNPPNAERLAEGEAILKSVYSELPSYEVVIPAMVEHGIFKLRENCRLQPGVPLKPMLAKPTKSITEVLDRFEGKSFTCEYKYDGERAQIHYVAGDFPPSLSSSTFLSNGEKAVSAIFSRNSEDLSKKYPDILAKLPTWVKPATKSFVLDCETVAWDLVEKKVLPFQQLMTRKRKDVKAEDIKVKVCVFAFDILFHNGEALVQRPFRERREILLNAFSSVEGEFAFAQYGNISDLEDIQHLLDEAVKASCEGLMVKMLDTAESGYEPSKRSRNWLKIKKDYLSGIGDSLDLVVIGAYFGKGKRTSVYGAFLLACYNSEAETFESVCNIGTGFSEAVLEELHKKLAPIAIDKPKPFYSHSTIAKDQPDVWFEPRFVWEVKTADLTLSPRYLAGKNELMDASGRGISLRFPRFIKERDDKKAEQATNGGMIVEMYRKQESIAKTKGPSVDDDFEY